MDKLVRKEKTQKLYDAVRLEYQKLSKKRINGKIVYSQDCILELIGEKFFRSPKTIENIIFNRV